MKLGKLELFSVQKALPSCLKSLGKKEKKKLLNSAGIRAEMRPEEGLALKASLGLPWNTLRLLRRYKV